MQRTVNTVLLTVLLTMIEYQPADLPAKAILQDGKKVLERVNVGRSLFGLMHELPFYRSIKH